MDNLAEKFLSRRKQSRTYSVFIPTLARMYDKQRAQPVWARLAFPTTNSTCAPLQVSYNSRMMELPAPIPEIGEAPAEETTEGPLYRVIIHNDDVTPMDFVLRILQSVFKLSGLHALHVMYSAHYNGQAYVQTLPKPEGVRRIGLAHTSARLNRYPLTFTLEPE